MKSLASSIMLVFFAGSAMATDYAVGIVNLGSGWQGGGTALNMYAVTSTGIRLIQTYVLQQTCST